MKKVTIALPKVILSFPHLIEKEPLSSLVLTEEARKYTATFLLSKDDKSHMDVIKEMQDKLKNLLSEIKQKTNKHILIKDGDEEYNALPDITEEDKLRREKNAYKKGKFIIAAKNKFQPILTTQDGTPIDIVEDKELFYPGCYVHAFIELAPYKIGNVWAAVSNRLQHVQFSKDGKSFIGGGRLSGSSAFDNFSEENEQDDFGTFKQNKDSSISEHLF